MPSNAINSTVMALQYRLQAHDHLVWAQWESALLYVEQLVASLRVTVRGVEPPQTHCAVLRPTRQQYVSIVYKKFIYRIVNYTKALMRNRGQLIFFGFVKILTCISKFWHRLIFLGFMLFILVTSVSWHFYLLLSTYCTSKPFTVFES